MKTFVTQPTYLPWIGIFKAIDYCDNFVFHDDVQFEKQSWQQRNRIASVDKNNDFVYLNVTVEKHPSSTMVKDIKIKDVNFFTSHLNLIKNHYHGRPFLNDILSLLYKVYSQGHESLADLNIDLIKEISYYIGLKIKFSRTKDLNVDGDKNNKLINLCKIFDTDTYLSAVGSKDYLDNDLFISNGIKIIFLDFPHPVYPQGDKDFFSHLSIIDILINVGPEETKRIIENIKIEQV